MGNNTHSQHLSVPNGGHHNHNIFKATTKYLSFHTALWTSGSNLDHLDVRCNLGISKCVMALKTDHEIFWTNTLTLLIYKIGKESKTG